MRPRMNSAGMPRVCRGGARAVGPGQPKITEKNGRRGVRRHRSPGRSVDALRAGAALDQRMDAGAIFNRVDPCREATSAQHHARALTRQSAFRRTAQAGSISQSATA